jgi:hypothetical protein
VFSNFKNTQSRGIFVADLKFKTMKKLFITAAIATLFSASVFADGTNKKAHTVTVSYTVVNKFAADFPNATDITWNVSNNYQRADFVLEGVQTSAFYNLQGEFVAITEDVTAKAVPAATLKEINEKYNGYAVDHVIVLQNNTELNPDAEETVYFADLKKGEKEVLVRITSDAHIEFYKEVK